MFRPFSSRAALTSVAASALAAAALALPAGAQAAKPGDVCTAIFTTPVTNSSGGLMYFLTTGAGFRIVDYAPNDKYYGHGNGLSNGYVVRSALNQSSCH